MGIKKEELIELLENFAPSSLAESWDNVGLLVSGSDKEINKILLALDLTDDVLDYSIEENIDFIITHHPVIFKPLSKIINNTAINRRVISLLKNDISLYTAHTNLDKSINGTNDALFDLLKLKNKEVLLKEIKEDENIGLGRIGTLKKEMTFNDFANYVKSELNLKLLNVVKGKEGLIRKVALCTGSAFSEKFILEAVKKECDVYISGDLTYHNGHLALDMKINLIDATHFATENIFMDNIKNYLQENLPKDINIIKAQIENKVFDII